MIEQQIYSAERILVVGAHAFDAEMIAGPLAFEVGAEAAHRAISCRTVRVRARQERKQVVPEEFSPLEITYARCGQEGMQPLNVRDVSDGDGKINRYLDVVALAREEDVTIAGADPIAGCR